MVWAVNAMPWLLYPWERPGTHCIGGWVGSSASQDWCGKSHPFSNVRTVTFVTGCYSEVRLWQGVTVKFVCDRVLQWSSYVTGCYSEVHFFRNCIKQLITYLSECNFIQGMKSRWMRELGQVACMEERRYWYRAWAEKCEGERCSWENNIKWMVKK
jgi:hypothetical protein